MKFWREETYIVMVTIPHKRSMQMIIYFGRNSWRKMSAGGHTYNEKLKRVCARIVWGIFLATLVLHNRTLQSNLQNDFLDILPMLPMSGRWNWSGNICSCVKLSVSFCLYIFHLNSRSPWFYRDQRRYSAGKVIEQQPTQNKSMK